MKAAWCCWYSAALTAVDFSSLPAALRNWSSRDVEGRVRLANARRDSLSGSYSLRQDWTERIAGADGLFEDAEIPRVRILSVQFRLSTTYPQVELWGARSAGRLLLKELASLVPSACPAPIPLQPIDWFGAIEAGHDVRTVGMVSAQIPLSSSVVMRAYFDGTTDIRPLLSKRFPALLKSPRKLVVQIQKSTGFSEVELGTNASARVPPNDEESRALLRSAIATLV